MCILSDRDIRQQLDQKTLGLEPFEEKNLTPNGYDMTVKEVVVRSSGQRFVSGEAVVPPMSSFLVSTREFVRMPADAAGQLWIRSSYARRGILAAFGKVEAGFEGELTIGCFNSSHEPVRVPVGDRFCQLAFEKMHNVPERLYKDRSGNYQGQRGVTLAR